MRKIYTLLFLLLSAGTLTAQTGDWTWVSGDNTPNQNGVYGTKGAANAANKPGAREGAVSWKDADGNLWLFGGYSRIHDNLNDLWRFNPGTGQWTWVSGDNTGNQQGIYGTKGIADATNKPGARKGAVSWTDYDGNLWLFGGEGIAATNSDRGWLNDLWKFNIATNQWTWVSGDNVPHNPGIYGVKGEASTGNKPGVRTNATSWTDAAGTLWLFGGIGLATNIYGGRLNDLWRFNPRSGQWTWVSGDNTTDRSGIYGTKGVASSSNKPGAREGSVSWTDANNNLWLFGGSTFNDLWRFSISTKQWTWVSGTENDFEYGVYGTKGVADAANMPGGRHLAVSWIDGTGNLWLFGGYGLSSTGLYPLGDLWRFSPVSEQWTWISGDHDYNTEGIYGTRGIADAANKPEGRKGSVSWITKNGNLWLFGGEGEMSDDNYSFNDLWQFNLCTPPTISSQPSPALQQLSQGSTPAAITVSATGNGLTYQWYINKENNNTGGSPIQGATENSYTPPATTGTLFYYVEVSNGCAPAAVSEVAEVTVSSLTTWYRDLDKDGFGNPNDPKEAAEQPEGYVADNTDCDDTKEEINPNTTWYIDSDGDGHTVALLLNVRPSMTVSLASIVANPGIVVQCDRPEGGKLASEVKGYGDCHDNNNAVHPGATETAGNGIDEDCDGADLKIWYQDFDGDGFGNKEVMKESNTQPDGFVANPNDCDDTMVMYRDGDSDGFGSTEKVACDGVANSDDCNDNDAKEQPGQTWYIDADGDGYTAYSQPMLGRSMRVSLVITAVDPNMVVSCTRPEGGRLAYELTGYGDCNDNSIAIHPGAQEHPNNNIDEDCDGFDLKRWFQDVDGDGFGNKEVGQTANTQPDGFVANPNDCDDNLVQYRDSDEDGFGTTEKVACGGAANSDDCNDFNPNEKPGQTWYFDQDGDGFPGSSTVQCAMPVNGRLSFTLKSTITDCDDASSNINPETTWYIDQDNDGFPGSFVKQCEKPANGKLQNELQSTVEDCNDTDPVQKPFTNWYTDSDGDGYAGPSYVQQCARPVNGFLASELTSTNGDCNNNNALVWQSKILYRDTDGDAYTTGGGEPVCYGVNIPDGFRATSSNTPDCNDNNASVWRSATLYVDSDGDGYTTGSGQPICYGATIPDGFQAASSNIHDCNDDNAQVWRSETLYADSDGDGFTTGGGQPICYGATVPDGFRDTRSNMDDCNDGDKTVWRRGSFYRDNDGDGYSTGGGTELCYGETTPAGYTATFLGNDCNDNDATQKPGQTWYIDRDGDGYTAFQLIGAPPPPVLNDDDGIDIIVSNLSVVVQCERPSGYKLASELTGYGDCNDYNNTIHPGAIDIAGNNVDENCDGLDLKTWYEDKDNDSFGNSAVTKTANTKPDGYVSNTTDCNDSDGGVWRTGTFYRDQDGDTHTVGTGVELCYGNSVPTGYAALNSTKEDCDDTNKDRNPGAVEVCGNGVDDNCNGSVDEGCFTNRSMKVNLFGGVNAYLTGNWNNWNVTGSTNITSSNYQYNDGTFSTVNATLSSSGGVSDNGTTYGGAMAPAAVLRYASFSTARRTLTFKGLNNAATYSLELYASRANTGNSTQFTIGSVTKGVVTDNNKTNKAEFTDLVPVNGQIVITINRVGSFNYLNGFILTETKAVDGNKAPVAKAGGPTTITLPASEVTANGSTSSDPDGTITSYQWNQVAGPAAATIVSPLTAGTQLKNLVLGQYKFLLTVTDNKGETGIDTLFVTVNPEPGVTTRSMKVNLFGGVNPFANTEWNNWNVTGSTNITSGSLRFSNGTASTITSVLSGSQGVSDNGTTYGGAMCPAEVLRYASYATGTRTLTLRGLNNALSYDLELYASRSNTGNTTQFTINGVTRQVVTDNNKTNNVLFTGLVPVNGQIVIAINRSGTFTYLNGFILTEKTPAGFTGAPPMVSRPEGKEKEAVSSEAAFTLTAYPNPFQGELQIRYTVEKKARVSVNLFDQSGRQVASIVNAQQEKGAYSVSYPGGAKLAQGAYFIRLSTLDSNGQTTTKTLRLIKTK